MPNEFTSARVIRTEILVDRELNSRKTTDPKKIDKLRDSIKVQGLIHPPLLIRAGQLGKKYEADGHPYVLVAGFRRQTALDMLAEMGGLKPEQQEADYRIAPVEWSIADALMANLTENLSREDLSSYELASQCVELADNFGLGAKEISNRVRAHDSEDGSRKPLSETHINNLVRCIRQLHRDILAAWKEGHPKAKLMTLIKLSAEKDEEAQLRAWRGVESGNPEGAEENDGGSGPGKNDKDETDKPARRPSAAQLAIWIEAVKTAAKEEKCSDDYAKGAINALRLAAGVTSTIPKIKIVEKEET